MSKEIYISSTPHETRLAIVENDALAEMYYERENEYTLAGSIYNGKVTRVLPGMQSSFVDIGLERDAFLYITDFMEEAGDSADFEANANAGDHQRAPRREGQRDGQRGRGEGRGEGRSRGDRDQSREPQSAAEPTDADLFTQAVAGLDPSRPSDSERSAGRRRRGRGRGEGRAQGNGESLERNGLPRPESSKLDDAAPIDGDPNDLSVTAVPLEDVGEGAPGADGSRRWRGRRGRRGSQPGDRTTPLPQVQEHEAAERPASRTETGPVANAYAQDSWADPDFAQETESDEMTRGSVDLEASSAPSPDARQTGAGRSERNHQESSSGDRDRNIRGRNERDRRPREAEAGESPRYGEAEYAPAPVEPIILPGESLSKYRGEAPPAREASVSAVSAPAASEFRLTGAWDGGLVLPGETIRPRSSGNREPARESVQGDHGERSRNDRGHNDRGRDNRRRDDRGRDSRPQSASSGHSFPVASPVPVDASGGFDANRPFESSSVEPAIESRHPEDFGSSHLVTPLDSTFVAPPPMPAEETVQSEREYEPVEASASYRVDPAAPSEFRQGAPVLEEMHEASSAAEAIEGHDVTSIFATGEMHSEEVRPPAAEGHDLPSQEQADAADSMTSESTVFSAESPAQPVPHFEPGSGLLEEEMLEDDEDGETVSSLSASAHTERFDHPDAYGGEHEAGEHETLEGAADLATMLREMSIDQITRTEPATLDEDDEDEDEFDEDFEEEDQDYDPSDLDDDEPASGDESEESFEDSAAQDSEREPAEPQDAQFGAAASRSPEQNGQAREPRREGRRDGRRDGRRGDRNRRSNGSERSVDRDRGTVAGSDRSLAGDRNGERKDDRNRQHGRGRASMQTTNLPAISDLLKPGQELLCQIAKEPIAKKGARITSHIALPGRFLVFMPTVSHTGVSRKIESDGERRRLKEILLSEKGEAAGGFIVRTAAAGASEEELRSDLRFLLNLWNDIKARSESSKSPALIYHDLNLVERVLRDQVTDTFSAIWVDTETEYERVLRFLQRFQPSLIRRVKLYTKETPLFEQFGITEEINKALRSKVWLKSGGSIVINQTEALVAIDINTGKFVGKTARLEDTIVKTNLDAIPEIVRQIRLRDLGGIIIIDFIDMDERKNRNRVMAALEEELKFDRAPSKVLQFNDFGLVAITRKRVKQSLERTLSTTCGICAGTGMVKSPVTVCNDIYVEMRKMQKHLDRGDVMLRVNPEVVKQLKSGSARWLQEMEEMVGKTILVKSDPTLHPEQFDIH